MKRERESVKSVLSVRLGDDGDNFEYQHFLGIPSKSLTFIALKSVLVFVQRLNSADKNQILDFVELELIEKNYPLNMHYCCL